jgi:hypothetical protein
MARVRDIDAHAARELVAADDGVDHVAGRGPTPAAGGVTSRLAPRAVDLTAAVREPGGDVELVVRVLAQRMFCVTALPATLQVTLQLTSSGLPLPGATVPPPNQ